MVAVVTTAFKGVVTKIEIDHSHAELEMINHELLILDQEQSTLLQEHKEQYQSMVAQRSQAEEIRSFTEVELEQSTFAFEQAKILSAMREKMSPLSYQKIHVEGEPDQLYYSFRGWCLYAVIIILLTTLYYIAFKLLFFKPLLLADIKLEEQKMPCNM
ncbi:TPA: hypothetical protein I6Z12_003519 [Vibrio cholerae]|nr:hypothetical protein [Vibrio cholerae]